MIGIDEVGRGCWAGPMLVVAARAKAELPPGLKDSKKLTKNQRQKLLDLLSICCGFGEGWVTAGEIDEFGLARAQTLGVHRALEDLGASFDEKIIIDGKFNYVPAAYTNSSAIINADDLLPIVSAASIYAKVARDKYMTELAQKYPGYSFEKHVGYGTKAHISALRATGYLKEIHRLSFAPLAKFSEAQL